MLENYIFKKIPLPDLEKAISLIWTIFSEFEAPEYCDEGVEEFKKFIAYDSMKEKVEASEIFLLGCYDDSKLVGIIGYNLKPHINLLFVDKVCHKRGIAKILFGKMVDHCKSMNSMFIITVNSSPYAYKIYEKLGFTGTNTEQIVNGIRFYPMKYNNNMN